MHRPLLLEDNRGKDRSVTMGRSSLRLFIRVLIACYLCAALLPAMAIATPKDKEDKTHQPPGLAGQVWEHIVDFFDRPDNSRSTDKDNKPTYPPGLDKKNPTTTTSLATTTTLIMTTTTTEATPTPTTTTTNPLVFPPYNPLPNPVMISLPAIDNPPAPTTTTKTDMFYLAVAANPADATITAETAAAIVLAEKVVREIEAARKDATGTAIETETPGIVNTVSSTTTVTVAKATATTLKPDSVKQSLAPQKSQKRSLFSGVMSWIPALMLALIVVLGMSAKLVKTIPAIKP